MAPRESVPAIESCRFNGFKPPSLSDSKDSRTSRTDTERSDLEQENPGSAAEAKQGRDATGGTRRELWWAEASIWTDRMVSALGNGVKGGKWFSLIDKVIRPATLEAAWQRVARNRGAAGVDGQSVERFAHQSARYLLELTTS
jgi:hypothetical protein